MILKNMDSLKTRKLELGILKNFNLPSYKYERVTKELNNLIKGEKGEKNTAYFLDFDLDENKNWMVIHDLRIEHKGKVAQIDHLIIDRFLNMYVLETKAFGDSLEMLEDGSFVAYYGKNKFPQPSPIEQNNRHIRLLRQVIKDKRILPKRLGINLSPKYENFVLLDSKTHFIRPKKADSKAVLRADQFLTRMQEEVDHVSTLSAIQQLSKVISPKSLHRFAKSVVKLHVQGSINYKEHFDITDNDLKETAVSSPSPQTHICEKCSAPVSTKVVKYCSDFNIKFDGKIYCYNCQKTF